MNKVQQAAGRVIRTSQDVGVILLLDDRFAKREYRDLFPAEWADTACTSLARVEQELGGFWHKFSENPPEGKS
jgi:Rad3-related DNA helicase